MGRTDLTRFRELELQLFANRLTLFLNSGNANSRPNFERRRVITPGFRKEVTCFQWLMVACGRYTCNRSRRPFCRFYKLSVAHPSHVHTNRRQYSGPRENAAARHVRAGRRYHRLRLNFFAASSFRYRPWGCVRCWRSADVLPRGVTLAALVDGGLVGHVGDDEVFLVQVGAATLRNRRPTSDARSLLSAWNGILGAG